MKEGEPPPDGTLRPPTYTGACTCSGTAAPPNPYTCHAMDGANVVTALLARLAAAPEHEHPAILAPLLADLPASSIDEIMSLVAANLASQQKLERAQAAAVKQVRELMDAGAAAASAAAEAAAAARAAAQAAALGRSGFNEQQLAMLEELEREAAAAETRAAAAAEAVASGEAAAAQMATRLGLQQGRTSSGESASSRHARGVHARGVHADYEGAHARQTGLDGRGTTPPLHAPACCAGVGYHTAPSGAAQGPQVPGPLGDAGGRRRRRRRQPRCAGCASAVLPQRPRPVPAVAGRWTGCREHRRRGAGSTGGVE